MLSCKVYERRPFELTLYFSAVYGLNIAGTPTVIAEPEMFGNNGTLSVFQIIEGFAENLQPPFVVVHSGRLGGSIESHVLRTFFTFLAVLIDELTVKIREHHIPDAADQYIFCYLRFTSDGKSNLIDGLIGNDPIGSDPIGSDPIGSDPIGSDPIGSDLGPLLTTVLLAADRVIIPVEPEMFAAAGLDGLLQTIARLRRINRNLAVAGLLIARVDSRSAEHRRIGTALRRQYGGSLHVFEQAIPLSEKVREAARKAMSPYEYSPRSYATRAYNKLIQEVLADETE